ncbi:MAG: ParB/RepB/Spo0J family partition protein [Candidatus Aminicenantes bacterium]|nr:ParB/RepB/Spo0J family partition protein [Candidatus Aminicenantes bacterium]
MPKSKKSGLPDDLTMRHDGHFVEFLSSRSLGPQIRLIPINKIIPNPQQARSELGDLSDLIQSIKEKGVLEPIIVRPRGNFYEIIAGERRYTASKKAGLTEIPCIEMDVDDSEALEIALIENLQRKNLNVFEEAEGLKTLADLYGYSHEMIAKKIGKARSTVTEIINLCRIPPELRRLCQQKNITSRSTLVEIAKQKTKEDMEKLIENIVQRDLTRMDTRELSKTLKGKKKASPKKYVYNYIPQDKKRFKLRIEFKKPSVTKEEIIQILEEVIEYLKKK